MLNQIFKSAQQEDYLYWLIGFLGNGGCPTHFYDYSFSSRFLVARQNFQLGGECGSSSRNIIVSPGVKHLGGEIGHNCLFYVDGFKNVGKWVPVYEDTNLGASAINNMVEKFKERKCTEAREVDQMETLHKIVSNPLIS